MLIREGGGAGNARREQENKFFSFFLFLFGKCTLTFILKFQSIYILVIVRQIDSYITSCFFSTQRKRVDIIIIFEAVERGYFVM